MKQSLKVALLLMVALVTTNCADLITIDASGTVKKSDDNSKDDDGTIMPCRIIGPEAKDQTCLPDEPPAFEEISLNGVNEIKLGSTLATVMGIAPGVFYQEELNLRILTRNYFAANDEAMRAIIKTRSRIELDGSGMECEKSRELTLEEESMVISLFEENSKNSNKVMANNELLSVQLVKENSEDTYFVGPQTTGENHTMSWDDVQDSIESIRKAVLADTQEVCLTYVGLHDQ